MAWCRLDDTFHDDPKWDNVADASGLSRATVAGHVAMLWSWCLRHAPDGVIENTSPAAILRAMGADTNIGLFDVLVRNAVLDPIENGFEVHGYSKRTESHNRAKQKRIERERSKQLKAKEPEQKLLVARQSPDSRGNVFHREERRGEEIFTLPLAFPSLDPQLTDLPDQDLRSPDENKKKEIADHTAAPSASAVVQKKLRKPKVEDPDIEIKRAIKDAYTAAFEATYPKLRASWGAREWTQLKRILGSFSGEEILEMVPVYLSWPNRGAIEEGHPFAAGHSSFCSKVHMLRADTAHYERHRLAAVVHERRRLDDHDATNEDQVSRVLLKLAEERTDARSSTQLPGRNENYTGREAIGGRSLEEAQ